MSELYAAAMQIVSEKQELEKKITALVQEFEEKAGLKIQEFIFDRVEGYGAKTLIGVQIVIKL